MKKLPEILHQQIVAQSRLFRVEQLEMQFSNGEQRTYERLVTSGGANAVMMAAINDKGEVLLVREYNAGVEQYQLSLPKGAVDHGESPEEAVQRELQEEIGVKAQKLTLLKSMTLAPGYMQYAIDLYLCEGLSESFLEGDEPEPLEVVTWPLEHIEALIAREDFNEGRAIAGLYLARDALNGA